MHRQPLVGGADAELVERLAEVAFLVVIEPRERERHGYTVNGERGVGVDAVSERGLALGDARHVVERRGNPDAPADVERLHVFQVGQLLPLQRASGYQEQECREDFIVRLIFMTFQD